MLRSRSLRPRPLFRPTEHPDFDISNLSYEFRPSNSLCLSKNGSSDYLGGCPVTGVDFLRHLSDVQWLQGDSSICCNTLARRSGGRLCWEATGQGISWSPMRQGRVSPWPRLSARGLFQDWHIGHRSHASVNPYAVRQSEIPPNSRMNPKNGLKI